MDAQYRSTDKDPGRPDPEDAGRSLQEQLEERIRRSQAWIRKLDEYLTSRDGDRGLRA